MKTLLKGGRVIDPSQNLDGVYDVLIQTDHIVSVEKDIPVSEEMTVHTLTSDQWVVPGLIDIHVHLRDPGFPHRETIESGTEAAIAGGFTAVCCMPNTHPVLDDTLTLEYLKAQKSRIAVYPIAAATKNIEGKEPTEMATLKKLGAVGFSDDGHAIMNAQVARIVMTYCAMLDMPFVCHAEDTNLSGRGCMHEGHYSALLGLPGVPWAAETVMIARDIELSRLTGCHVHFTHVSAKESIALIRRAKAEGLRITADVTPHHIALTDAELMEYDADFRMNPPLRTQADVHALVEALQDGTVDAIATDHAPYARGEKNQAFDCCPNGVIGLETSLGVVLTHLYHSGKLTAMQIVEKMSTGPAQCLGLPGGTLQLGAPADITVIDSHFQWQVNPEHFKSKARNCPFKGHTLQGKAIQVFSRGRELFVDEYVRQIPDLIG
jgi:dihydroorotase